MRKSFITSGPGLDLLDLRKTNNLKAQLHYKYSDVKDIMAYSMCGSGRRHASFCRVIEESAYGIYQLIKP